MVTYKKCFQSEDEIEHMLEKCESEGASVFSSGENSSQSESENEDNSEVFQVMDHDSLWDEIATETNRFAVQFYYKNLLQENHRTRIYETCTDRGICQRPGIRPTIAT